MLCVVFFSGMLLVMVVSVWIFSFFGEVMVNSRVIILLVFGLVLMISVCGDGGVIVLVVDRGRLVGISRVSFSRRL